MQDEFYRKLFEFFLAVAHKTAPQIAHNEDLCREIFHERVLFPKRVTSVEEAVTRIMGKNWDFKDARAYSNWMFTVLRNAILDYLRMEHAEKARSVQRPPEAFTNLPDPQPEKTGVNQEIVKTVIAELETKFSREEKRLLTLRYNEGMTLQEVAAILGISTSTASRWEGKLMVKLREALLKKEQEMEDEEVLLVLSGFLEGLSGVEYKG